MVPHNILIYRQTSKFSQNRTGIHSFIHILHRLSVTGGLEVIPGGLGHEAGYTIDGVPIQRGHTLTHWKLEYPWETHQAREEYGNSMHADLKRKSNR